MLLKRCISSVCVDLLGCVTCSYPLPKGPSGGSLLPAASLPSLCRSEVFRLALIWSLPSALVPWPREAHSSHESMKEMPLTQKFTLGAVKLTPES